MGRMCSIEEVERWIEAGTPMVVSIAWNNERAQQRLSGTPLPRSDSHLLVIRSFTASGDVVVNDPSGSSDADVPRA